MIRRQVWKLMAAIAVLTVSHGALAADKLVVGGKNFTEQLLVAEITAQYLAAQGYDIDRKTGMGSALLREAQENGQIDLYWEYTGTSLQVYNKIEEVFPADETYAKVKELDADKGIVWLNPSTANNTFAIGVRNDDDNPLHTISDLAEAISAGETVTMAAGVEFLNRKDGLPGLMDTYGFKWPRAQLKTMEIGLTYNALKNGDVDAGMVYSTDGRIMAFNFRVLEDDKGFFPPYAMTPVVRAETLEAHPELEGLLNGLAAIFSDEVMQGLNAAVDVDHESIEKVASEFLKTQGLV
ncbi:MAG: glycine betaine ABC transporter substrate-binding protein [Geminicoccaceae bacterium]